MTVDTKSSCSLKDILAKVIHLIYTLKENQDHIYGKNEWKRLYWYITGESASSFGIWWRHQMEKLSASLALCAGNSPASGGFPYKGQWHRAVMFSLIYAWTNCWVNNRYAGDFRRPRAHYDVTVMSYRWYDPTQQAMCYSCHCRFKVIHEEN